jgi:hypothetical protein
MLGAIAFTMGESGTTIAAVENEECDIHQQEQHQAERAPQSALCSHHLLE